ncbi:MAG: hypothetical protein LBQ98_00170 [Nitrososphaerota archaeon]|nr:hypothetical protein [Nitrososphaerota archaeon]
MVSLALFALLPFENISGQPVQDHSVTFFLLNHPDGDKTNELTLTIPQSLYLDYAMKNHYVFSSNDFSKFVTPYVFKPVADTLWKLYNNTEDFTNGVLMLVHQITYEATIPCRYPVETLVLGKGDCDLFAYVAASILEAGGISTVLLYYEALEHVQIAVDLGQLPVDVRTEVFHVSYQNVPYYIAECTGSMWRSSWRVGECPENYQNATAQVVSIDDTWPLSVGQVFASFHELDPSAITLQCSPLFMVENTKISLSGQILPLVVGENVTVQVQTNGGGWITIATVPTQQDGKFNYTWVVPVVGQIEFRASWIGDKQYNGAYSNVSGIVVLPLYFIAVLLFSITALVVMLVVFIRFRNKEPLSPPTLSNESEPEVPVVENTAES